MTDIQHKFQHKRRFFPVRHSSSRYDRLPSVLHMQVKAWAREGGLISFTEVADPERARALKVPGWDKAQKWERKGSAECAILSDGDDFTLRRVGTAPLTKHTFEYAPGKDRALCQAVYAILQHRPTGALVLSLCVHFPSGVQDGSGWSSAWARVKAYRSAMRGLRNLVRNLRRRYRVHEVLIAADFNLDLRRVWVRGYLRSNFPRMHVVRSTRGTHGPRVIDGWITTLNVAGSVRVQSTPTSDHHSVSTLMGVRAKSTNSSANSGANSGREQGGKPHTMAQHRDDMRADRPDGMLVTKEGQHLPDLNAGELDDDLHDIEVGPDFRPCLQAGEHVKTTRHPGFACPWE